MVCATLYSASPGRRCAGFTGLFYLGWVLCFGAPALEAQSPGSSPALEAFAQANARLQREPTNTEAAWQFGRACFDLADAATNRAQRASVAEQGIAACKRALVQNPDSAPLHYYLALDLGELARTRSFGALRLVDQMEGELLSAIKLDPRFDHAGAERSLGLLYRDAPTLFSIGSKSKARLHLQRAVQLAPQFPENRLDLLETELKWHDRKGAKQQLEALEELWPKAKTEFSGPAWKASWADWENRLEQAKRKLE